MGTFREPPPYAIHMNPQQATELARVGATLLVLRMPECTHFGVDQHAFSVGPKFMGVKMVPPGAHFISYRALNKEDGSLSPATGFFWWAQPRDVQVRMWDPQTEALVHVPDPEEAERYAAGVRRFDFDAHLAPYNLHGMRAWHELSSFVTDEHVARISPVCGNISIMAEGQDEDPRMVNPKTEAERKLADQLAEGRAKRAAKQLSQQQQQQQDSAMDVDSTGCDASVSLQGFHDNAHPHVNAQGSHVHAHHHHHHHQQQQWHVNGMDIEGGGQPQAAPPFDLQSHVRSTHSGAMGATQAQGEGVQGSSRQGTEQTGQGEQVVGSTLHSQGEQVVGTTLQGQGEQVVGGTQHAAPPVEDPTAAALVAPTAPAAGDAAEGTPASPAPCAPSNSSGRCFYSPLPRFVKRPGMTPAELTAMNMDKTTILQQVAHKQYRGKLEGLIGELQFAFIAFVFGQSLDGYAQWKALLLLFLGCQHAALYSAQPLFAQAMHVLRVQLEVSLTPDSFASGGMSQQQQQQQQMHPFGVPMVEELLPDSFLRHALGSFFQMLEEHNAAVTPALFREAAALKVLLKRTLGWEYDFKMLPGGANNEGSGAGGEQAEGDEDGPIVVENPSDLITL